MCYLGNRFHGGRLRGCRVGAAIGDGGVRVGEVCGGGRSFVLLGRGDGGEGGAARGIGEPPLEYRHLLLGLRGGGSGLMWEGVSCPRLSGCGLGRGSVEGGGPLDLGGVARRTFSSHQRVGVVPQSRLP